MNNVKQIIKTHQQKIVLTIGYLLVASLAFGLGRFTTSVSSAPEIRVEEAFSLPLNYNSNQGSIQLDTTSPQVAGSTKSSSINCQSKIKGSSSHIYHVPGGAFYDKTTKPIRCFDTEAQATAAGFRKSSR